MKIENCKLKIFVMLSGGVDSSVAAARLVDAGFNVEGIYMQNWSRDNISNPKVKEMLRSCSRDEDIVYAKATADYLKIPFQVVNFEKEYWEKVINPFFDGIAKGWMPNPDIWCNQFIKYGVFLDWALANGADIVASGHYARLQQENSKFEARNSKQIQNKNVKNLKRFNKFENLNFNIVSNLDIRNSDFHLLRGVDESKDQSYFLSQVPKEKLRYALFPIGHLYKTQVREEALARGLPTATKRDSQGICFVGKVPIKEFLKEKFKEKKGDVILADGIKIGEHDGVWFYTIGQRFGVDQISNLKSQISKWGTDKPPLYIIDKEIKRNLLVVGPDDGSYPLWKKEFEADNWNWFEKSCEKEIYDIEIRYHQQPKSKGKILETRNTKSELRNNTEIQNSKSKKFRVSSFEFRVFLQEPVRAVTPGQSVVISKGEVIVGAGIINS